MTIIRSPRVQRDFTIISNSVCLDSRLSMRALGLLVRLLCRPDNWRTNSETLAREFDVGREQMRGVLRELSEAGYMRLIKARDDKGQWATHWAVFDCPQESPEQTQPEDDKPAPGNPYSGELGAITRTDLQRTENNTPHPPKGEAPAGALRGTTLRIWLEDVKTKGEQAIPENDPVFAYAEKTGIPDAFLHLAWKVFKDQHTAGQGAMKRQKSWRQTFRTYVEKGYMRLWYINTDGQYALTTAGIQAQRAHEVSA